MARSDSRWRHCQNLGPLARILRRGRESPPFPAERTRTTVAPEVQAQAGAAIAAAVVGSGRAVSTAVPHRGLRETLCRPGAGTRDQTREFPTRSVGSAWGDSRSSTAPAIPCRGRTPNRAVDRSSASGTAPDQRGPSTASSPRNHAGTADTDSKIRVQSAGPPIDEREAARGGRWESCAAAFAP